VNKKFHLLIGIGCFLWSSAGFAQTVQYPPSNTWKSMGSMSSSSPIQDMESDPMEGGNFAEPDIPVKGQDETPLSALSSSQAPDIGSVTGLINARKEQTDGWMENATDQVIWFAHPQGRYCRFTDLEGNTWFGLLDGQKFQWVLWAKDRYWWHDSFAGRWLTFANGYWWFPGDSKTAKVEVYLNGDYHSFDPQGMVLADRDPVGELKSDYNGPFQGDFQAGQAGGRSRGGRGPRGQNRASQSGWQGRGQWNANPGAT
jgi:hypothetical protein